MTEDFARSFLQTFAGVLLALGDHYPIAIAILSGLATLATSASMIVGALLSLAPIARFLASLTTWTTRDDQAVSAITRWLRLAADALDRFNRHVPRPALGKNIQKGNQP